VVLLAHRERGDEYSISGTAAEGAGRCSPAAHPMSTTDSLGAGDSTGDMATFRAGPATLADVAAAPWRWRA
jgi:hypothetical protein